MDYQSFEPILFWTLGKKLRTRLRPTVLGAWAASPTFLRYVTNGYVTFFATPALRGSPLRVGDLEATML